MSTERRPAHCYSPGDVVRYETLHARGKDAQTGIVLKLSAQFVFVRNVDGQTTAFPPSHLELVRRWHE